MNKIIMAGVASVVVVGVGMYFYINSFAPEKSSFNQEESAPLPDFPQSPQVVPKTATKPDSSQKSVVEESPSSPANIKASAPVPSSWKTYKNTKYGYSFSYPGDMSLSGYSLKDPNDKESGYLDSQDKFDVVVVTRRGVNSNEANWAISKAGLSYSLVISVEKFVPFPTATAASLFDGSVKSCPFSNTYKKIFDGRTGEYGESSTCDTAYAIIKLTGNLMLKFAATSGDGVSSDIFNSVKF